ncbi:hypothetical protein FACS189472_17760 [Alphaproteobacteria bacterium]|nr:hypothetical protein FACS189472_17760 [Alphaproteobacteria bacterium]
MNKNITENFKTIYLQSDIYYVSCKLEESIPKGIIVYYPLVSFIYAFFWKISFDKLSFFSILKKIKKTYTLFFAGLLGLLVLSNKINGLEVDFKTKPRPDKTKYLKCKTKFRNASHALKFESKNAVKKLQKRGQQKFLIFRFMFRKSFLFSHPPPKAQNNCQQ